MKLKFLATNLALSLLAASGAAMQGQAPVTQVDFKIPPARVSYQSMQYDWLLKPLAETKPFHLKTELSLGHSFTIGPPQQHFRKIYNPGLPKNETISGQLKPGTEHAIISLKYKF
jgi:hypothetical protein